MAGRTDSVGAVLLHLLAERHRGADRAFIEWRNVRRGRGRRRAENVIEDVLAANHDRSARGIAGNRENAALAENAAALFRLKIDAPEVGALDAVNPVVFGEELVEIR